jgi:hypothetical protein
VIDTVHPDILQVLEEPDTQFNLSGYAAFDPTNASVGGARGAANFVRAVVGDAPDPQCVGQMVSPLHTTSVLTDGTTITTTITAGTGTWLATDRTCPPRNTTCVDGNYSTALAGVAGLGALDAHVYPVINTGTYHDLDAIMDRAAIAHAAGKDVTLSEFWATKETAADFPANGLPTLQGLQNDYRISVFSFWPPVDEEMLAEMDQLARVVGIRSISPFWSDWLLTNLDYTPGVYDETTSYAAIAAVVNAQVGAALTHDTFTPTGAFLRALLAVPYLPTPVATLTPTLTPTATATRTPRPTRTPRAPVY